MLKPDSRIWFPFFAFVSTLVAIPVVNRLDLDKSFVVVVSSLVSALLFFALEQLTSVFMNNYKFRLLLDERAKFEGEWLEYHSPIDNDKETPYYSLFRVKYTGKEGEPYLIKGNSYYPDGRDLATWTSARMKFDRTSNRIDYFYFGHLFDAHYEVKGFAHLNFNESTGYSNAPWLPREESLKRKSKAHISEIHSGRGFFVDTSANGVDKGRFHFFRLTDDLVSEILRDTLSGRDGHC